MTVMKASYQAFFLSSLSSDGKETASSRYTWSLFSLGRKKKRFSFKKYRSVNTAPVLKEELSDNSS